MPSTNDHESDDDIFPVGFDDCEWCLVKPSFILISQFTSPTGTPLETHPPCRSWGFCSRFIAESFFLFSLLYIFNLFYILAPQFPVAHAGSGYTLNEGLATMDFEASGV